MALVVAMNQAGRKTAFEPPMGGMAPGYGGTLLGMVLCVPWLPLALLAVATNYRSRAAWLVLLAPPLIVVGALAVLDTGAAQKPVTLTIGPVVRAGTNSSEMEPSLQVTIDDRPVGYFTLRAGENVIASNWKIKLRGVVKVEAGQPEFSGNLTLDADREVTVQFLGLKTLAVTQGGKNFSTTTPLPPGRYDILIEGTKG
jgi:hypothetical protein